MAINNFHFKLDIEREDYIPKFKLKQYDTAIFYVSLYKNGLPYHLKNEQIKMFVKKTDGTIVYQEDNISIEDDEVKINVENQALVCSGLTYAELEFKSSDGQVTSSTFLYEVKEKVGSDKAIESVTDIATLDKLKKYMEDAKKELERFKNELSKIEDLVANKDKLEGQNKEAKENIVELEKVLEDANNITSDEGKFITGNNIVSESTNGYIQDLKLYGRSLINQVIKREPFRSTSNIAYASITKSVPLIGEEVYTFIPYNLPPFIKQMYLGNSDSSVVYIPRTMNLKATTFIAKDSLPIEFAIPHFYADSGVTITAEQLSELEKSKFIIVKGDLTSNPPPYFEGLLSAGNGNEIEVLSRKENGNLINKEEFLKSLIDMNPSYSEVVIKDNRNCWHPIHYGLFNSDYKLDLGFEENTQYILKFDYLYKANDNMKGLYFRVMYTDGTYGYPVWGVMNAWSTAKLTTDPNKTVSNICATYGASYAESWIDLDSIVMATAKCYNDKLENKQDKKTILFKDIDNNWKPVKELRGIDLDRCDTLESNKYYKFIKSIVFNNNSGWFLNDTTKANTIRFSKILSDCEVLNNNPNVLSDKLKNKFIYGLDEEGIFISRKDSSSNGAVYIRINRNKLETPDIDGFGKWLQNNNVTMLYKVDKEEVYECLDITTRAFRDKTMLSINSGVIDSGVSYYVPTGFLSADNSISEKVETLDKYSEQNIKDINDLNFNMEQNYFNINRGYVNDFNDATQEGKYFIRSWDWLPNCPPIAPEGLYGILQVMYKSDNELFQFVTFHTMESWARFRNSKGLWSSWYKTVTLKDFETQHGSNGFLKFPNGSVLQFGSGVTTNGVLRINFKLTFVKSDDIVLTGSALDPSPQTVGFRNLTTTGCELTCSWASNPVGVKWFAFGEIK